MSKRLLCSSLFSNMYNNCNLAFLVDTSDRTKLDGVKEQLYNTINCIRNNTNNNRIINTLLIGFNSYITEMISLSPFNKSSVNEFLDGVNVLSERASAIFRINGVTKVENGIEDKAPPTDNDTGANYELAFHYASKWFADYCNDDSVNKTIVFVSQNPSGEISNSFTQNITNAIFGMILKNNTYEYSLKDPTYAIIGDETDTNDIIKLDDYTFGKEYVVYAENSAGNKVPLFIIGTDGMGRFETRYNLFWNRNDARVWYKEIGQMASLADPFNKDMEYPLLAMYDDNNGCWTLGYITSISNSSTSSIQAKEAYNVLKAVCGGDISFVDIGNTSTSFAGQVNADKIPINHVGDIICKLIRPLW